MVQSNTKPGEFADQDQWATGEMSRGIFCAKKNSLIISELTFSGFFCAKKNYT